MSEFEFGFDIDEAQKRDEEKYLNNQRAIYVDKKVDKNVGKKIAKLKPIPLSELMNSWKPAEWIVDLVGAKSACVLLAGDKGSGKSAFMYRMAESITTGSIFMNELATKKAKVFIWQADESRNNAQLKLKMMDLKGEPIFLFNDDEGGDNLDIDILRETIKENNIDVVFIDSITGLLMGHGINIKDSEFCVPLYKLNNLASELNILIIISAHLTKQERVEINMNDILGAGTQGGAVSDVWSIRTDEDDDEIFYMKCLGKRYCEKNTKWRLEGNKEDYSFKLVEALDGELLPDKRNEYRYKVLNLLMTDKDKKTYQELARQIGFNEEHSRRICTDLFKQDKINRKKIEGHVGRPFYRYFYE